MDSRRKPSPKRQALLDHLPLLREARSRKAPLSYAQIAKILSKNNFRVSSQLVAFVCKNHVENQEPKSSPARKEK